MDSRLKILAMCLLPMLVEPLTGNTPWSVFLNPVIFAFLFVGYSLPVLLIRELWARKELGLAGLLLLGFAYGMYNEGIMAKTMLRDSGVPVATFDGYGLVLGFNVPWSLTINLWHALFSVAFPILIFHFFFPEEKGKKWLGKISAGAIFAICAILGILVFFGDQGHGAGQLPQFLILLLGMGALAFLSLRAPKWTPENGKGSLWAALGGFGIWLAFVAVFVLATAKPNFIIMAAEMAGIGALFAFAVRRLGWTSEKSLVLLAFGGYFSFGITFPLGALGGDPLNLAGSLLLLAGVVAGAYFARRK